MQPAQQQGRFFPSNSFLASSLDPTSARCRLFRVLDPANELIPAKRRQAFPQGKDVRIRSHCRLKIFTCLVDSALGKASTVRAPCDATPKPSSSAPRRPAASELDL
jgi:hypothetical protein